MVREDAARSDDRQDEVKRQRFNEILPAIRFVAAKMSRKDASLSAGDLVNEASLRLWRYLDNYDPSKGKLTTFCMPHIYGAINDAFRNERMPGQRRDKTSRNAMQLSVYVEQMANADGTPFSVDEIVPDEFSGEACELFESAVEVEDLLKSLPAREAEMIRHLYLYGRTMKDTAKLLGLSESRVSQVHKEILEELRERVSVDQDGVRRVRQMIRWKTDQAGSTN